ncbi:MAG TPA: MucB/RseB C-terminal domain-containing protein [Pseudomonadales bacterium]|nr:MucB/RseB C-terminal domain-containing protein [Pseudomonadales bacterium]
MTRPGLALVMLGCLLSAGNASAEVSQDPAYWFKRSAEAAQTVNFDGHCVYINDGKMSTLKVVHRIENGKAIEHVVHVNGPSVQLEHRDGELQILPGQGDSRVEQKLDGLPLSPRLAESAEKLQRNYDIKIAGTDRVAERVTVRMEITPKDEHRFGQRFWFDEKTGLLLRSMVFDATGQALEIFEFVSLQAESADGKPLPDPAKADAAPVVPETLTSPWTVGWLPAGFALVGTDKRVLRPNTPPAIASVYSDGLASFTVFFEKNEPIKHGRNVQRGATVALTRYAGTTPSDYWITLVGEVPMATASSVLNSFKPPITRESAP